MSISQTLLNNPTYNIVNNVNNIITLSPPFKLLYKHICAEACAESGLYDDMKCHEGTRKLILERLENWVAAPGNADRLITWLDGPMGSGKTSVAVTVAERASAKNELIGSFVFRRGQPGRNEDTRFVATLAYQMALSIPLVRPFIEEQISYDQSILKQSLSHQLDALILKPLRKMRSQHPEIDVTTLPHLIIIDGLDECGPDKKDVKGDGNCEKRGREEQQVGVLELLHRLVLAQGVLPFAVLVHSRPEIHINHWFGIDQHAGITNRFTLDSSYKPDDDIRVFVTHGFLNLLETHPFCVHLRSTNWPYEVSITYSWGEKEVVNAIDLIVERSEGLFIYASIVMGFISSKGHSPSKRLLQILERHSSPDNGLASPYTTLDTLYTQVLDSISNQQLVRRILVLNRHMNYLVLERQIDTIPFLLSVLSISMDDFNYFAQQSASILTLEMKPFLMFQHSSLAEFLESRERSQNWCLHNYQSEIAHDICSNAFKLFSSVSSVKEQLYYHNIFRSTIDPASSWIKGREGWQSSSLVKEFKDFCDFLNSSYHTAVMRVLTSDSLHIFLDDTFFLFNGLKRSSVETNYKTWARKFSSHIRTLVKPHAKPYLKNPRTFAIFLCRLFDIPASNTNYMEDIPSPPSCPFALAKLFDPHVSFSVRPEWLLYVFSIPNRDFLCEAITILLMHAGRPSVMFCLRGIHDIINILHDHFDLSQELWIAILDCDEYFAPYLRGPLHEKFFVRNLHRYPLTFGHLHHHHQYRPNPIQPLNIALGECYCKPPKNIRDISNKVYWFLKDSSDICKQIVIPSVPPLARYTAYCHSGQESIPVPPFGVHCSCSRGNCYDHLPDWMRP